MKRNESSAPEIRGIPKPAWIAVLALSPIAYLGSVYFAARMPTHARPIAIDRDSAIQLAMQTAASLQLDAQGWTPAVLTNQDSDLSTVEAHTGKTPLDSIVAPVMAQVTLRDAQNLHWIRVDVSPEGKVFGFQENTPDAKPAPIDESQARAIAEAFLRQRLGPDNPFPLLNPHSGLTGGQAQHRRFGWDTEIPGMKEAKTEFHVEMSGARVIGYGTTVKFDPEYMAKFHHGRVLKIVLGLMVALLLAFSGIYAILRFFRRKAEREISGRRTLAVAFAYVAFSMSFIVSGQLDAAIQVSGTEGAAPPRVFFYAILLFTFTVMGLFFGVAYGAGEGDVREAYPGKLTSLDALLSGKLFSANVARSILAGAGFAGWVLLFRNVCLMLVGSTRGGDGQGTLNSLLLPYPLLGHFSEVVIDVAAIATFSLLLPISILRPRLKNPRVYYPVLALWCAVASTTWLMDGSSVASRLVSIVCAVAASCIPFFLGDLLAAISSLVAVDFVAEFTQRGLLSAYWRQMAASVVAGAVFFLVAEIYFAWRGRLYEDREVRPPYAKFMEEHLAMQAEIGAARQAQLRLLPDKPPHVVGISIAASCLPAREVGGDFYDFYPIDDHRIGIFLAEGGNRELGSAMAIALAKGVLLYATRIEFNPVEVLRRLRETLAAVLQQDGAAMSVLYAVIDARTGHMRFARTGGSPQLSINGQGAAEEVVGDAPSMAILHGAAVLKPKDAVFFYTDGLVYQIEKETGQSPSQLFARMSLAIRSGSANDLHTAVLDAAMKRKHPQPPDDVTAVVIRMESTAEQAMEGVA